MGPYLGEPVKTRKVEKGNFGKVRWAASSMQGWRKTQEDAHIAEDLGNGIYCFGVFDGHGGLEVATYVAEDW